MINFKEIFVAWKTALNPTELEDKIASDRLDICVKCTHKKEIFEKSKWALICEKCGCPLRVKVFSREINPCPMGFWEEPDNKNGLPVSKKSTKTFL